MNYTKLLEGKKALVTGGANGMGLAISKLFAKHGAAVAICGRSHGEVVEELQAINPECFYVKCDVSVPAQLNAFCEEVMERWGYVDIIVNVVGVNARQWSYEIDDHKYEWVQRTNMKPMIAINRYFVPKMIERGQGGSIISISSVHGTATVPLMGSYAASKGAMQGFTRVLANELSQYGIRANVVASGGIFTGPGLERAKIWMEENPGKSYKAFLNSRPINPNHGDGVAVNGRSEDIANHCLFLASDMSSYITGQTIMCDGGASYAAHKVPEFPYPDYFEEIVLADRENIPYADQLT